MVTTTVLNTKISEVELDHTTGIDAPDLAAKKIFYCFESFTKLTN